MSDHDDTPPPDQPMPESVRARLRADLLAATGRPSGGIGSRRSWVVPVAAAAGLLAVVAATGFALARSGGSSEPRPDVPASQATQAPTPTVTEVPSPTGTPSEEPAGSPSPPSPTETAGEQDFAPCEGEAQQVLRGAASDLMLQGPEGTTTFYVAGNRYVLCDDSGGNPTVHAPHTIDPAPPVAVASLKVSTGIIDTVHRHYVTAFVAGGLLPAGVATISYSFPDGHVQKAEVQDDDQGRTWWRMVYIARDGIITEPGTNQLDLDPITVHVTGSGGTHDFTLRWALDTCAQVNHGC